jgi:hypothetical protein
LMLWDIDFFLIFFLILSWYVSWFSILEILILHLIWCSKNDTFLLWYLPLKNQYLILIFEPHQFKILILTNMQCSGLWCTEIYGKNARRNADTHFVRACAVETHVKISQEPFYTEIYRKNAATQSEHPDQAPAITLTGRTPQCSHTVWGKTQFALPAVRHNNSPLL